MPRDYRAKENQARSKARREHALLRLDLREPSSPREPAAGPTSHAVKLVDVDVRHAIDEFLKRQNKVDNV